MKLATVRHDLRHKDRADCAELWIDGQNLLIGNKHVQTVEPASRLKPPGTTPGAMGELEVDGENSPVFCFDRNLRALEEVPPGRRSCVVLESLSGRFAILCDELRVVDDKDLELVSVPGCLRGEHDLVDALVIGSQKVRCLLSVDRLAATLSLGCAEEGA
jgi:chemotaxis signal transduction protein